MFAPESRRKLAGGATTGIQARKMLAHCKGREENPASLQDAITHGA